MTKNLFFYDFGMRKIRMIFYARKCLKCFLRSIYLIVLYLTLISVRIWLAVGPLWVAAAGPHSCVHIHLGLGGLRQSSVSLNTVSPIFVSFSRLENSETKLRNETKLSGDSGLILSLQCVLFELLSNFWHLLCKIKIVLFLYYTRIQY